MLVRTSTPARTHTQSGPRLDPGHPKRTFCCRLLALKATPVRICMSYPTTTLEQAPAEKLRSLKGKLDTRTCRREGAEW